MKTGIVPPGRYLHLLQIRHEDEEEEAVVVVEEGVITQEGEDVVETKVEARDEVETTLVHLPI